MKDCLIWPMGHTKMHFSAKCNSGRVAIQWFHIKHFLDYQYTNFQPYTFRVQKMCDFARYATLVPRLLLSVTQHWTFQQLFNTTRRHCSSLEIGQKNPRCCQIDFLSFTFKKCTAAVNYLRNRSALAVNCWVIINCLEVSRKEDQITSA